jgi:hypothetical protein
MSRLYTAEENVGVKYRYYSILESESARDVAEFQGRGMKLSRLTSVCIRLSANNPSNHVASSSCQQYLTLHIPSIDVPTAA